MKRQQLRIGMRVTLLGQEYVIEQRLRDGQVLLKHLASGTLSARSEKQVAKAMSRGEGEVLSSPYERDETRYGRRVADIRAGVNESGVSRARHLDSPQIDHTKLDLVVIDEKTSVPIIQPWLEIHTCAFTRRILAFKAVHGSPDNQN
jgi:hypothetical protein